VTLGVRNASGAFIDCCDPKVRAEIDATIAKLKPEASKVQDYRNVLLNYRPVAGWMLDAVNGTAIGDITGNGRGLTLAGTYTLGQTGPFVSIPNNRAISFNGTSTNNAANATAWAVPRTDMTWLAWINPTVLLSDASGANFPIFMSARVDNNNREIFHYQRSTGDFRFVRVSGGVVVVPISGVTTFAAGVWSMVAVTRSGNSWAIYKDGVSVNTATNATALSAGNRPVSLGSDLITNGFNGAVAAAAVYDYALAAADIQALYLQGVNGINPVLRGIGV
jgi:hypothetical protein